MNRFALGSVLLTSLAGLPAFAQPTPTSGAGTSSNPYLIADLDDFGRYVEPTRLSTFQTYSDVFKQDVVASLPERQNLTLSRPQLIAQAVSRNLRLTADADVTISFVHEGAGYRNVAGVFPFETANPPSSPSEVEHYTVFPNASFRWSGGGLYMGQTIDLGRFDAGTSLGFWLNANGWKGDGNVTGGNWTVYSIDALNGISDPELQRQTILLRDPDAGRFVIAFEDIRRDRGGDQDFNDVILTIQVTPYSAVDTTGIPDLVVAKDVDGDGVNNSDDDYPDDPSKAYKVTHPLGTLAYEDLWPARGDYDFNDLVVSYECVEARDADNKVVELTCTYTGLARGAAYHNGLWLTLPLAPDKVASVHRTFDAGDEVEWELRQDQSKATVVAFEDAHLMLYSSPGSIFCNTEVGKPRVSGRKVAVRITFAEPLDPSSLGEAPYDTFLKRGGVEVHLPGFQPSDTIDPNLIGTVDDATEVGTDNTFKTPWGQPWVLRLPGNWKHPSEKRSIEVGYRAFVPWTESGGERYPLWYANPEPDDSIWRELTAE